MSHNITTIEMARKQLRQLEERIPWNAVKKMWGRTRDDWVAVVGGSAVCSDLANQLIVLESMLKAETLSSDWQIKKVSWKTRMGNCHEPKELELATKELEGAILWQRILVAPDGRPLSEAEIASGQFGVGGAPSTPLPPPLSTALAANKMPRAPPEGVPRLASRMLLLLQSMGANSYDPKVVVQLMDVMYGWTASVLVDAATNARMRVLPVNPQVRPLARLVCLFSGRLRFY